MFMEPNLKAKENRGCDSSPIGSPRKRSPIVTIAAAVSRAAMVFPLICLFFLTAPMAQAQQADRLCSLSGMPLTPLTTRRLIEQKQPCPLPAVAFTDATGTPMTLGSFHGKVVLLNLWATWCPPCVKEMPALNRLQQKLGSDHFAVVAISQDRGGVAVAGKWLKDAGLTALPVYADPGASVGRALESPGLPVSLLLDEQGRELARLYGPADWDSADMIAALTRLAPGISAVSAPLQ